MRTGTGDAAGRRFGRGAAAAAAALALAWLAPGARGQALSFGNRREVQIPDYATLRIGPFYSTAAFGQSAGYRYTRSSGTGTDFIVANRRGQIVEDGSEFPLVSDLTLRNYLLITRTMDLDMSVRVSYEHYPLETQEDEFRVELAEEGIYGNLSSEFALSPYLKGTLYDTFLYRTDFIDTRGIEDVSGGTRYPFIRNDVGANMDWLMAANRNVALRAVRTDVWPQRRGFEDQRSTAYHEGIIYEQVVVPNVVVGARADWTQTDYALATRPDTELQSYQVFTRYGEGATDEEGVRVRLTEASGLTVGVGYSVGVSGGAAVSGGSTTTNRVITGNTDSATMTGRAILRTQLRPRLSHTLGYYRVVRGGFRSAFETVDRYRYQLDWNGQATRASGYSELLVVEPSGVGDTEYDNWTSGAMLAYPIIRAIVLNASTAYAVRRNRVPAGTDATALLADERYDYDTWTTRLSTTFHLTRSITFNAYAQHFERTSAASDLAYERDIVGVFLRYFHQF